MLVSELDSYETCQICEFLEPSDSVLNHLYYVIFRQVQTTQLAAGLYGGLDPRSEEEDGRGLGGLNWNYESGVQFRIVHSILIIL